LQLRTLEHLIFLDPSGRVCYNDRTIECNIMIDPTTHNVHTVRVSAARVSRVARPMLAGGTRVDEVIPVDVRIRAAWNELPTKAIPVARSAFTSLPVGTLLDCYL
jgi:hypothetical protein